MVARVKSINGKGFIVAFCRDGEPPQRRFAIDGREAWSQAIALISQHETMLAGDRLAIDPVDAREEGRRARRYGLIPTNPYRNFSQFAHLAREWELGWSEEIKLISDVRKGFGDE